MDGVDRFALVALDPRTRVIVAVVRYEREAGTDGAEYAALVEDRFQGRGLGIGTTRQLIEAARERGIGRLHALVMRENRVMLSCCAAWSFPSVNAGRTASSIEIDLRSEAA